MQFNLDFFKLMDLCASGAGKNDAIVSKKIQNCYRNLPPERSNQVLPAGESSAIIKSVI